MEMFEDMGEYRRARTWEKTDVKGHGRMQMSEDVERFIYRFVRTWEDADMFVHGRMQVCRSTRGYRCVGTWEVADV